MFLRQIKQRINTKPNVEWNKVINEYIQSENGPEIDSFHHDFSICKMLIRGYVFQHNQ